MAFGGIAASPRCTLSPLQALQLAMVYLENASKETDINIALALCQDTEVSLLQAKRAAKHAEDQHALKRIGTIYIELGKLLHSRGYQSEALRSYKKAEKLG
jgi:TPR repeat protein